MLKKSITSLIFVFLSISILASCDTKIKNDPIHIDEQYLNKQIAIRAPNYANTFNTNDSIILELKYQSNNEIVFPRDYNIRIFEKSDDDWNAISKKPTVRNPPGDIILSPEIELPVVQVVIVFPDLPDLNRKYFFRVYVLGEMMENSEIKEVVAYTELTLQP